jgi:hypothetical protein
VAVKIREPRRRWLPIAVLVVAATTIARADMVKCKKADGGLYVGASPPENCVPVGTLREHPASGEGGSSWKPGDFRPTPTPAPDTRTQDAEAVKQKEIERKRAIVAVAIQNMVIKPYRNGHFFEGTVQRCQPVAPATLFPGAQGTFSFEVPAWNFPDYRITWDVVPSQEQ